MKTKRLLIALALGAASVLGASATDAFRQHRYDSFKATPTEPNQIVFAGNSITNMHSWFEAFGSHQEVIGRGNSGGFAYELLNNLESYIDSKPSKFFVMIGTNDISSGQPVELTHKRIMAIVKRVRLESPDTEIYVESILPRNDNANPKFPQCNVLTKAAVEEMNDPKVHFVDLTQACAGIAGGGAWSYDKLHPRPIGYAAWCHVVDDMVGYPTVYPETITSQNGCGLGGSSAARVEQFPYFPVSEGDVLLFGDEQIHGGEWHELLRSPKIKDRGQNWGWGGMNLTQAKNVVASALKDQKAKPAKIFLCYGVGGKDLTNYRLLVDEAKKQAPQAQIYIMSLTPSRNENTDKGVVSFNTSLQEIATEKGATFVDVYTPLHEALELNIMNNGDGNCYVSGRGYVVMANALAPYLQEEGVNPVSLEEYEAVYANRTARSIIGNALTDYYVATYGSNTGDIKEQYRAGLEAKVADLATLIGKKDLTQSEATAAAADFNSEFVKARADVNLPKASTDTEVYWYNIVSQRGSGNVSVSDDGKLVSNTATATSVGNDIWKFVERGDGSYDIVNPDGLYISPAASHNTQMSAATERPAAGFTISYSNASPGNYVIYSGNCQLNQTNNGAIFNWHGGTAPNRTDEGCSYSISLFEGTLINTAEVPYESGWYQLQREDNGMYIRNLDEPTLQANKGYWYSMQYVAEPTATPKDWVYVEVDGNNRRVRTLDGFYTGEFVAQARDAYNVSMTATDTRAYKVQYYTAFNNNGITNVVGRSQSANFPHLFNRVSKDVLNNYDIWTVKIQANTAATTGNDTHVVFDSAANKGIKAVYNNGVFFVEPGTVISESDLTVVPAVNVSQELETPTISIDSEQKKIVVYFIDLEPKVTLLDREFNADSEPYRVADKLAEPILSSEASTAAFHITYTYSGSDPIGTFAAAADTTATNKFFAFGTLPNKAIAVRYVGNNGLEGHYSQSHSGGYDGVKIVVVNDPNVGYSYYVNGANVRSLAVGTLGDYGFKHFGNIDNANALYIGGFVTDDNKKKYMLNGTIHSARFWNRALTAEQVADLSYENLKETQMPDITDITEVAAPAPKAHGIYDLTGRRVVNPTRGLYIVDGRKVRL